MKQRKVIWVAVGLALLGGGAAGIRHFLPSTPRSRVYRIGFGNDVPFQFQAADGAPAGVAVEIVKEAARRRGIQLQWSQPADAGIGSILSGETDFWVLLTDLPARHKQIYITEPYLTMERSFLVLKGGKSRAPGDLTHARIAYRQSWSKTGSAPAAGYSNADELYLKQFFPGATLVPIVYESPGDLAAAVREQRADAAMLNKNIVAALLLAGGARGDLDLVSAPGAISQLALGASFEAEQAAREIREEIGAMAGDGSITRLTERWGFFENASLAIIGNLSAERRARRLLGVVAAGLAAAVVFIGFLAIRLRRERDTVRNTQVALRASEGYYRSLVELLPDTIYRADEKGKIEASHFPSEAGMDREGPGPDLRFLEASDEHRRIAVAVCREGRSIEGEETMPDGRVFEFRLIPTVGNAPMRAIGILRDVTAARAAEEERRRFLEERQGASRLESLGRLAGGVAHDFNNLLTIINGYSSLLWKSLSRQPDLQRHVTEIQSAGASAASLIEELLAFSQKRMLKPVVLDVNSVILGSARMLEQVVGDEITLDLDLASGPAPVTATTGGLQQVLINLAANARDAMPDGGRLGIRTEMPEAAAVSGVRLTVTDTGQGIPPELLDRIFEPFFTTKEIGKGTGLGLATVYGIVKQQGGSITVESGVGQGTTFRIWLPTTAERQPGAAARRELPAAVLPAATILLAEDDPRVRALAAGILRSSGCTVLEAVDGEDAIEISRNFGGRIDLLVSDLMMPRMRGSKLAEHLRLSHPGIPVLLLTGYAAEAVDGLAFGESFSLLKPFSPDQLVAAAAKALAARG